MNRVKEKNSPFPKFPIWCLGLLKHSCDQATVGDLEELYFDKVNDCGKVTASFWLWWHVIRSVPVYLKQLIFWSIAMMNNYFKITLRNIKKYKSYSFINIIGLTVGMVCTILIMLWVRDELSYDRFYPDYKRIYRITYEQVKSNGAIVHSSAAPPAVAHHLKLDFSQEVEYVVRVFASYNMTTVSFDDMKYQENKVYRADADFYKIFKSQFLFGHPETALEGPGKVVFTESVWRKYFGDKDPLNKVLSLNGQWDVMVTGVVRDIPNNAHFSYDLMVSLPTYGIRESILNDNWGWYAFHTYCLLNENYSAEYLESKMGKFVDRHVQPRDNRKASEMKIFHFQPLSSIHLHSNLTIELGENGKIEHVWIFSAVAVMILLLACMNFTNLSTARAMHRAREIGMRKVCGAARIQIIRQFLSESIIISLCAFILALILIAIVIPWFNVFTQKNLSLLDSPLSSYFIMFGISLLTGFVSGAYPALVLSRYKPVHVLKGGFKTSTKEIWLRRILVSLQFIISITLIICIVSIQKQNTFMKEKDLGYEKDHMVLVSLLSTHENQVRNLEKLLASKFPEKNFSVSYLYPTHVMWAAGDATIGNRKTGEQMTINMQVNYIDQNFLDTYQINLLAGRNFSRYFATDSSACLINETALRKIGWMEPESALGEYFTFYGDEFHIVGVMEDIHFESLHQEITPTAYFYGVQLNNSYAFLSINIRQSNVTEALAFIEKAWNQCCPNVAFDYSFIDERYNDLYKIENRQSKVFGIFSILAIVIGCLGLVGLVSFSAEQRSEEIGIRKVLGAEMRSIVLIMLKEFVFIILLSNVIAWPIAYFYLSSWLERFAYKTDLSLWIFILSGIAALLIAIITIGFQVIRASLTNPVEVLKYE